MELLLATSVVLVIALLALHRLRVTKRRERARELADELIREIRDILESCDPHGRTSEAPDAARHDARHRLDLERLVPEEVSFAVATFYESIQAYDEARRAAEAAFRDDSALGLGDRIRAKDRRDRCLKDVYDAGESAAQKLEALRR